MVNLFVIFNKRIHFMSFLSSIKFILKNSNYISENIDYVEYEGTECGTFYCFIENSNYAKYIIKNFVDVYKLNDNGNIESYLGRLEIN